MMHVAIVCEYASINGGENSILAMIDCLQSAEVTVLAPRSGPLPDLLDRKGLRRRVLSLTDESDRRLGREAALDHLQAIVQDLRPDLVHANSLSMGRLTGALRSRMTTPTSAHLRDILRLNQTVIRDLNGNDALIAVSQATANFHVEQGLTSDRTRVLYNGIDPARFAVSPQNDNLRQELGLPPHALLVGTIGQITLRKGHDLFVKAAIELAQVRPDVYWLIVGERYSRKPETVAFDEQLRKQVRSAGLEQQIRWLGYREDIPRVLAALDLLVHPARQEPLGRVLLEAGASALPIVATNVGGTGEILEHDRSALLVPPDDTDALVRAIALLLDDRERGRALGRAARESIGQRFALKDRTAELEDVWHRLVVRNR